MKCEIKTENEIILIKTQNIYYNTRWSTFFSFRVLNLLEMTILFCDINFTMLIYLVIQPDRGLERILRISQFSRNPTLCHFHNSFTLYLPICSKIFICDHFVGKKTQICYLNCEVRKI